MTPRSEEYKKFVRSLPCSSCGSPGPSEPHHVEQGGVGIKGSDYSCIPLCNSCHRFLEDRGHRRAEIQSHFSVSMAVAETLHQFITGVGLRFPGDLLRELFKRVG
jgi:hypothetical protein